LARLLRAYTLHGNYIGNLTDAFITNKTFCQGTVSRYQNEASFAIVTVTPLNTDSVLISTWDPVGLKAEDGLLFNTPIEIRVYY
jgi:hypothetical protein